MLLCACRKQKTAQVAAVQGRQQDAEQRRLLESELSVLTEEQVRLVCHQRLPGVLHLCQPDKQL